MNIGSTIDIALYFSQAISIGFKGEYLGHKGVEFFDGYNKIGDVLFVDAQGIKEIG